MYVFQTMYHAQKIPATMAVSARKRSTLLPARVLLEFQENFAAAIEVTHFSLPQSVICNLG